jgi:hypothetical protein
VVLAVVVVGVYHQVVVVVLETLLANLLMVVIAHLQFHIKVIVAVLAAQILHLVRQPVVAVGQVEPVELVEQLVELVEQDKHLLFLALLLHMLEVVVGAVRGRVELVVQVLAATVRVGLLL